MTTLKDVAEFVRHACTKVTTGAGADLCDLAVTAERYRRMAELVEAAQALREARRCPNCEDVGWYIQPEYHTGEAEQAQCQWCYETPDSRFNALAALDKLEQEP